MVLGPPLGVSPGSPGLAGSSCVGQQTGARGVGDTALP